MTIFLRTTALALAVAGALLSRPASAEFSAEQMQHMLAAAQGLGQGQAAGDACGTDMTKMAAAVARGWKCQGASADQLTKLQAAIAEARKGGKVASCPVDKAAHAAQIAKATADLEAGLAASNCKG